MQVAAGSIRPLSAAARVLMSSSTTMAGVDWLGWEAANWCCTASLLVCGSSTTLTWLCESLNRVTRAAAAVAACGSNDSATVTVTGSVAPFGMVTVQVGGMADAEMPSIFWPTCAELLHAAASRLAVIPRARSTGRRSGMAPQSRRRRPRADLGPRSVVTGGPTP